MKWTPDFAQVAMSVLYNPKTLVMASHSVGKTHGAAGIVLWHYHNFNPSITLTTAPTDAQVVDLLWKEIRDQAPPGTPLQPKAPEISDPAGSHHYAKGYVARDANSFQGRHEEHLLVVFDEATGVASQFWNASEGMLTSGETNRWLAILNPTDTSSRAYAEYDSGEWNVIQISALSHPNIQVELADPAVYHALTHTDLHDKRARREMLERLKGNFPEVPYPKAVRLSWIIARVAEWTTPIPRGDAHEVTDLEFPPGSGIFYHPGPLFEGRVIGRWPTTSVNSVWSEALVNYCFTPISDAALASATRNAIPVVGCDVARFGNDLTSIHVQANGIALHHESHNGWSTTETAGRLKQVADRFGSDFGVPGTDVPVNIDDDGVGGGVVDQADGYNFLPRSGASASLIVGELGRQKYPNRRSEVWFEVAALARAGRINFSRLDPEVQHEIRRQLLSPVWSLDSAGRQVVERKADTKKRLERSPDDADAINLAHAPQMTEGAAVFEYYYERRLAADRAAMENVSVTTEPQPQPVAGVPSPAPAGRAGNADVPDQPDPNDRDPWSPYNRRVGYYF